MIAPAGNPTTAYQYDAVGNLTKAVDPFGVAIAYSYDAQGRRVAMDDSNVTYYVHDAVGNLVTSFAYLPSLSGEGGDFVSVSVYDALNRVVDAIDARQGTTHYAYDALGRQTSLTDPSFNATRFEYDGLNRLTRNTDPLGHARSYAYDAADNLVRQTDRNGRARTFEYDNLGRQTDEHWLDSLDVSTRDLAWTYDLAGQLLAASDPTADYAYGRDVAGRIDELTQSLAGLGNDVRLDQTWDALDRRTSVTGVVVGGAPAGVKNDYQYDPLGRMTQVVQSTPGASDPLRQADFSYTPSGNLANITRSSVVSGTPTPISHSAYYYNADGRLQTLLHYDGSQIVPLAGYALSYDRAGQIDSFTSINPADGTADYGYDANGQLIVANYSTAQEDEEYVYDLNGNRAYDGYVTGANNQLLSDGEFSYEYDHEGNRAAKQRLSSDPADDFRVEYGWDYRQRLTQVTFKRNDLTITKQVGYEYDAFDRLVARSVDSDGALGSAAVTKTFMVHDDDDVILDFVDTDAASADDAVLDKRYLHGLLVDQVLAEQDAGTGDIAYYLADHLGSIRDVIDNTGDVVNHVRYDAFGNVVDESDPAYATRSKFDFCSI